MEKITEHVMKIDDELKMKLSEYVMAKNSLSTIARKTQGSLATRDLGDVVREEDMVETENLTTLLVTIPKFSAQDWLDSYETLAQFVVPRSSKMLKEENDYSLFTVTLFRRTVDSFKNAVARIIKDEKELMGRSKCESIATTRTKLRRIKKRSKV